MAFTFFVSKRFLSSKKEKKIFSFFSLFALTGIAIGVATLIIALSVLRGFEKIISQKLVELDSHIQIVGFADKPIPSSLNNFFLIKSIIGNNLESISPYVSKLSIISHKKIKEGVNIKGIENSFLTNSKSIVTTSGKLEFSDSSNNEIIIGKILATKLLIKPGNVVTVFALKNDKVPTIENMPNIEKFKVIGIFESGMSKYDDNFAYVHLKTAQKLFEFGSQISGYEIKLKSINKIDSLASVLQTNLRYPHYVRTVFQLYRHIFNWIELQKKPIPIILGLIIIVAVVNIISTLIMLVLEKMSAIGTLRALGARKKQINRIFLLHGIYLGFLGVTIGNILAYTLSWIQIKFDIITLPSSVYFTSKVPLELNPLTFAIVSILTFLLCIAASFLPSFIASRINPINTLRFS